MANFHDFNTPAFVFIKRHGDLRAPVVQYFGDGAILPGLREHSRIDAAGRQRIGPTTARDSMNRIRIGVMGFGQVGRQIYRLALYGARDAAATEHDS